MTKTRKSLLIIGVIAIVIGGVLISAYYSNSPKAGTNTNPNPATEALTFDTNTLINRGVTSSQMDNLQQALGQYFNAQGKSSGHVSFNSVYRTPPDPKISTPFSEIGFMVQLDGQPAYKAKLDSFGASEIRLYLYSPDGNTLLYDSQNIGGSSDQS